MVEKEKEMGERTRMECGRKGGERDETEESGRLEGLEREGKDERLVRRDGEG